jgi:hypothetical protein
LVKLPSCIGGRGNRSHESTSLLYSSGSFDAYIYK